MSLSYLQNAIHYTATNIWCDIYKIPVLYYLSVNYFFLPDSWYLTNFNRILGYTFGWWIINFVLIYRRINYWNVNMAVGRHFVWHQKLMHISFLLHQFAFGHELFILIILAWFKCMPSVLLHPSVSSFLHRIILCSTVLWSKYFWKLTFQLIIYLRGYKFCDF